MVVITFLLKALNLLFFNRKDTENKTGLLLTMSSKSKFLFT